MTTRRSQFNNTSLPLQYDATYVGGWERVLTGLEITVFLNCSGLSLVTIEQSVDASNVQIPTTFNYVPSTDVTTFSVSVGLPFFRVRLHNGDVPQQAYLSLNTYLVDTPPTQVKVDAGDITVSGSVSVINDVSCNIISPVDVSGNILTALPTLSYDQSAIGSLVAPQQLIGCKLMGVASTITHEEQWINDGGAIPVFGTVGIDSGNNTIKIDPASSLPAGSNVIGLVGIDVANNVVRIDDGTLPLPVSIDSAGNTVQLDPASQLPAGVNNLGSIIVSDAYSTIVVTSITNPLPAGSNTLGVVGIDPAANTTKIDQTSNGVKINPTAQPPVRVTGLGDTSKSIGGPGLLYGASYQNKSASVNCWIKLYDSVGAPTAGDTPFVIQYLESVQQYNLTSANDNFFNTPIVNTLWVRATLLPADDDVTDTGIDAELTCFVGV